MNKIRLFISFLAVAFFLSIVKEFFFINDEDKKYEQGWKSYEKKDCEDAIICFSSIDINKYPDVLLPLNACYIELEEYDKAIESLRKSLDNKEYKLKNYGRILGFLGYSYLKKEDLQNARIYLELAVKNGDESSIKDLEFLDSLEQEQIRETSD